MIDTALWNLDTIIAAATPTFFIGIFLEIFYSIKLKKNIYRLNDTIGDLSLGIVQQLTGFYFKAFPIYFFYLAQNHLLFFTLPQSWLGYGIAFVLVDFAYYWFHRYSHEVNFLWASHVAHHSSEEYNLAVALRQSSVESFLSAPFYVALVPLGVTWEMFGVCFAFNLIYQFWIHTQVISTLGPLEYLFNTPSHHRVHHGKNPKYIDKNYAGVFIVWDKLFGTFKQEEEAPAYGITTPLNSFDPIRANFHLYWQMFKDYKSYRSILDFLHYLLKKPGWRPDYLGGVQIPTEVNPITNRKFDPSISKSKKIICVVLFILMTGVGVALQNVHHSLSEPLLFALIVIELLILSLIGATLSGWKLKN